MRAKTAAILILLAMAPVAWARSPYPPKAKWIGTPITLKTSRIPLQDVLRLIAEASGFNLILGDGVGGDLGAISWTDVPWDQALDTIIKTKRLHAERSGNMLRIVTNEEFIHEQDGRRPSSEHTESYPPSR